MHTPALVLGVVVMLFGVAAVVFSAARGRDRTAAIGALASPASHHAPPAKGAAVALALATPPTRVGDYGVTRRQFFNGGITTMLGLGGLGFATTTLAFLWPTPRGAFGSKIRAGELGDLLDQLRTTREPVYVPEGRFYLTEYPSSALAKARDEYAGSVLEGMEAGVVALYQKCPHLGCRVPWCGSAQWFECPCHQSKYNRVGEKKEGPAPRGMDRFGVEINDGVVVVDTRTISLGPAVGTDTTGQSSEGPHCV